MTSTECAMFKVFLRTNDITEVKKFVVDDSTVITSFLFMKEKLQSLFPKLRETSFRITWRDSDGDDVIIDNDEDLILAFTEMEGSLKTLYVTVLPYSYNSQQFNPPQYTYAPPRVVCDSCNNEITTYRYKCLQCFDYDLCGNCEHAGHHAHHMMLRTSTPELPLARCGRKIFEQVNKAVKKANHMAYKECKRKSKWDKKKSDGNEACGEETSKNDPQASGCPFEDYVPQFTPFMDAFSNVASAAATAAAQAATNVASAAGGAASQPNVSAQRSTSASEQASKSNVPDENNPTSQFMEAIRNALSGVFVQQPYSQSTAQPTNSQTQPQPNQPTATPNAPTNEHEIDLTGSPVEPMDTSSQREPGWTIINQGSVSQPQFSTSNPVPTEQPSQPQHQSQQPPQPQHQSQPQVQYPILNPTLVQQQQQPHYPVLHPPAFSAAQLQDPHIAMGLSKLMEMGFSDEQALISLLKRYNGSVDEVIKAIFENK